MSVKLKTSLGMEGDGRTMRIIGWRDPADGSPCFTLVLEWWRQGRIVEDERRTMDAEEAQGLFRSLQAAISAANIPEEP